MNKNEVLLANNKSENNSGQATYQDCSKEYGKILE